MGVGPRRGHGGRRTPMAEINVTPLVDVMLVLLIIFMITAPLLMTGVPINLPDSRAKALEQPKKPTQISIDPAGQVYVDDDLVSDAELPQRLQTIAEQSAGAPEPQQVFLRADRTLQFEKVMQVMGELNRAGLNKISIVSTAQGERE
ncbi:ExbD/TolR family protein [Sphingomonas sp. MAHUQ-71]|uniref:ExbD/TolR family protein n=2 Tax=Sphingomonas oryzagri TaxID=3042314 RepID=A0ABT6N7F4_9SPHN|nr:ExbD/TolR family protein [Sphingomonas oryzagri]MDH7641052.1 ExbD/TolR family protein [Sphingomonas oryzagri]